MTGPTAQTLPDMPEPPLRPAFEALQLDRPGRLFLPLVLAVLAVAALLVALPHPPYLRYQALSQTIHNRVQWSYERIHFDPTPIDIAVIGNSRMGAGVNAPALSAALSERFGRPVHLVNLSTPQEGRNLHWVMAEELIEARPEVSLILMSVIEQAPRDGHPAFRDLAPAHDVLTAPWVINREAPGDLAFLPYRQLSLFLRSLAPERFGMRAAFDPTTYKGPDDDTTVTFRLPDGTVIDRDTIPPEPDLRRAGEARMAGIRPPFLPTSLARYEFAVERQYTERIAAAAAARGIGLGFIYLPVYTNDGPIDDRAYYEDLGFILDGTSFSAKAAWFSDYGHLNTAGARKIVPWLTEGIAAAMASQGLALRSAGME